MNYTEGAAEASRLADQVSRPDDPDTYRHAREIAVYHLRAAARSMREIAAAQQRKEGTA